MIFFNHWLILFCPLAFTTKDTVTVTGVVTCNSQTAGNVVIRLWDRDNALDPDDFLAETKTGRDGNFTLSGKEGNIEPYIQIEHMCKTETAGCWRNVRFPVPKAFVNNQKPYDMTYVALDIHWPQEETKCS